MTATIIFVELLEKRARWRYRPMKRHKCRAPAALLLAGLLAVSLVRLSAEPATHGMVASVNPLATEAGVQILKSGGNAIDAAVAVGLMLGVVDGANSGVGGGCLMLVRLANGRMVAIDGRETAPAAATRDMFIRDGKADPALSQTGALASGVPGEVAAFDYAVKNFGRKKFGALFAAGAKIAMEGFVLKEGYAARLKESAEDMAKFEEARRIFFKNDKPLKAGDVLKQPDLAKTYRALGEQGADWFYRGPFAEATAAWMKANGGIMTAADFAAYRVKVREPVSTAYRGYQVVTFPPPSSGGVHLLEMLNTLEHFDLKSLDEASRLHVIAEAMKLAFADRAHWLGDPDFAKVPRGLTSKDYASTLAKKIDPNHAMASPQHGTPRGAETDVFAQKHTTHFSVADAEGNWVACTCTVNTSFGSKVAVPGTGVFLNNQMDDFSAQPGVPNYFGLIGAEANAVAPGKRPLSSMTPTIVLKSSQPVIALGAAGGPRIITAVLLEVVAMLDLNKTPAEALAAPRIHHQWFPDELYVESSLDPKVKEGLRARGQKVQETKPGAVSQIVARSVDGESFVGAADPRGGGNAEGW
jgi:gamma-glutamyltranspeptidase/glutathione hydrolase